MKILILNGPNLNRLGRREPEIYGSKSFDEYFVELVEQFKSIDFVYRQTNHEGAIVDLLHEADGDFDGVVLNAGAYSHTSIAIADAIASVSIPVVEVHISNIYSREKFRHHSMLSAVCRGVIVGFGLKSYSLAINSLIEN